MGCGIDCLRSWKSTTLLMLAPGTACLGAKSAALLLGAGSATAGAAAGVGVAAGAALGAPCCAALCATLRACCAALHATLSSTSDACPASAGAAWLWLPSSSQASWSQLCTSCAGKCGCGALLSSRACRMLKLSSGDRSTIWRSSRVAAVQLLEAQQAAGAEMGGQQGRQTVRAACSRR